jgi:hypothetical protein
MLMCNLLLFLVYLYFILISFTVSTRPSGRPRYRWQDEVREDGRIVGGEEWQEKVYNREEWKKLSLRRRSMALRLLRLWVRIPPGAWMSVCCECCLLSGRCLCDGLIIRPEESYRLWRVVCVISKTSWMRRPLARVGLQRHIKKKDVAKPILPSTIDCFPISALCLFATGQAQSISLEAGSYSSRLQYSCLRTQDLYADACG